MNNRQLLYAGNLIRTYTGLYVDVINPKPEMFCIEDIAHSLSHQCRFGGHVKEFFSVAQHSYNVSKLVPAKHRLAALMHDAAEAYMLDMPKPIKDQLTNYKAIENRLMYVLSEKFGFEFPLSNDIKKADSLALENEFEHFMMGEKSDMTAMLPQVAKSFFLKKYHELTSMEVKHV